MTSKDDDELLIDDNGKNSIHGDSRNFFFPSGIFGRSLTVMILSMVSNEYRLTQTIAIDRIEAIYKAEINTSQIRNDLDDIWAKEADVKYNRKKCKTKWNEHNSSMQKLQVFIFKLYSTIEEIQLEIIDTAELDNIDDTIDLE